MSISLFKKKKKEKLPARRRGNSCLNCEITLNGDENFCPDCGQRNNTNPLSFKLVVDEFVGNLITYDSRVWNTAVPLIFKPGKVAYEFISGKRKNFVNPFRTYLTVSLLFFLIYGLLGKINELRGDSDRFKASFVNNINTGQKDSLTVKEKDSIAKATLSAVQKNTPVKIDSVLKSENINIDMGDIKAENISIDSLKNLAKEKSPFYDKISAFYQHYDKNKDHSVVQALDSLGYKNNFWNRFYYDRTLKTHDIINDGTDELNQKIFSGLSLAVFIFLPIFALFLKFIYIRRKYTYMEHMVFIFYTQSVFFLLMLLFVLISYFTNDKESLLIGFSLLSFSIYLLLAMKKFYNQGWIKTFLKYIMANFSFMVMASIGLGILVAISFIFY